MQLNITTIKQQALMQKNKVFRYTKFFADCVRNPRKYYDALQFSEWVMTDMEKNSIEACYLSDIFEKVDELGWSSLKDMEEKDFHVAEAIKEEIPSCFSLNSLEDYVAMCEACIESDNWQDALENYSDHHAAYAFYEALRADNLIDAVLASQEVKEAMISAIQETIDET